MASPTPLVTEKEQRLEALLASLGGRVDAIEQQLASTSQLASQLNTFAVQIAANESRLEERLLEMANSASVEQRLLQAKLETVETTFQRCSAALQELQAAVFAAPGGAPPGAEPPGFGGLRDRLDELTREANRSGGKERELEDKLVALTVAMQANHTETAQRLTWTSSTLHQAILELVQRVEAGICRCPATCPGGATASAPPCQARSAPEQQPARAPAESPCTGAPATGSRLGRSPQEAQQELRTLGANTGVATEEYQEPQAEHQEPLEAVAAAAVAQAARAVVATMLRDTRSSTYPASRMTALAMGASC